MTPQEIKYIHENTTLLSIFVKLIEFINLEIDEDKEKSD